ncbi:M23 family metallopeptidase [Endozoicomonas numazuensis]|uniref:Membrane protein n=1 Tax=Endozoicomonas numazuensis TaxID=1137799 RepID=A0A081NE83_9GAMM|nr:M23 family metallopeptidase [Endozoicomonas numazuensis]KEQ16756.1 membrane protein [Endozoicomonas numazuensis]
MKVIVVKQDNSRTQSFRVTGRRLTLAAISVISLCMVLGGGFTYLFLNAEPGVVLTEEGVQQWQETLSDQKKEVENVRLAAEQQIDALTIRLAELQGRITRLDALGERLTVTAKLDDGEFSFDDVPAIGGPEELPATESLYSKPSLIDAIDQLSEQIDSREQQFDILISLVANRAISDEAFIAGLPVKKGWLSSRFGQRTDPFTGKRAWHSGIDMAGKRGSDIIAVAAGVVTWSGDRFGYGLLVEINHGNGYVTRYAHNQASKVKVGDIVTRGQAIAEMGSSGRSTGPHVHFEVIRHGKHVDPQRYIYRASK